MASAPLASLFVEVPERFGDWLHEVYDCFAIACFAPATMHRETRLVVEGDVCPLLIDGLGVAMAWYRHWYGPRWAPLAFEAGRRADVLPASGRVGAIYFSCGVDSLYSLRRITAGMPSAHWGAPRAALFVIGYDLRKPMAIERALANAQAAADLAGLTLVPVRSNIPSLDDDYNLWTLQFGGPGFAALAHALGRGIARAWLGADCDIPNLVPWCNHPATAPEFSSHDVEIRQDGIEATRAEKVGAIADWDIAQRHLRVCTKNPEHMLNCGRCEKCVRTRLELLAFGSADALPAFGGSTLSAADVNAIEIRMDSIYYDEIVPPLRARGREDLIAAIDERKREWARYKRWRSGGTLRARARRLVGAG
ncbi:MAG: hypothetical protein GZ089_00135 [Aromatoleum sp.]|nr:hypothetical protein [Aromatoleum sp.]